MVKDEKLLIFTWNISYSVHQLNRLKESKIDKTNRCHYKCWNKAFEFKLNISI